MKTLEETLSIVESLNENAHNDAWDSWVHAEELANSAEDDDEIEEAEDLRDEASAEQASYFRHYFDELSNEDKTAVEHWIKADADFRDQFSSWFGQDEFDERFG